MTALEWMDGWMDGWNWMDGWMDGIGWMDGWMDGIGWMCGWKVGVGSSEGCMCLRRWQYVMFFVLEQMISWVLSLQC